MNVQIFKSTGGTYNQDVFSRIDEASFQYRIGAGTYQSIEPNTIFVTRNDNSYSCLGTNPVGKVVLDLPDLQPGETLDLIWDVYHCNNI